LFSDTCDLQVLGVLLIIKKLTEMLAILSRVEFLLAPQVLYTTRPDVRRGKLPKPPTGIKDPFQVLFEIKSALIKL